MAVPEQKPSSCSDASPAADNRSKRISELLQAALDLFAEHGFVRVTAKSIGRACGMNAAKIYYYFENKEDLFRAVIERAIAQMPDRYRDMQSAHNDPVRLIEQLYEREVVILEENIAERVRRGNFSDVDPRDLARFVSVHLDRIIFASLIRSDMDLAEMVNDLKRILWTNLATSRPAA